MNALRTIPNRASLIGLRFSSTQTHSAANAAGNDAGKAVTEGERGKYPSYKEWRVGVNQEEEALRRAEESARQPSRA